MMTVHALSGPQPMALRSYRIGLAMVMLLALAGLAFYGFQALRYVNGFGFPLDDSWIHLQIARNLANGYGWSYNPGEPTGAATAPLWILFITPLFFLGGDVTIWVKALGALLYLANVLLVASVASLVTSDRRVGLVAGALAALQPAFLWTALSGMETALYLLLFLLSLRSLLLVEQRGSPAAYASTAWLAFAGWARPEMWTLLPLFWGYLFWRRHDLLVGRWWVHIGIAGLAIGGFALFNMMLWGHPVPSTLIAKQACLNGSGVCGGVAALVAWASRFVSDVDQTLRSQNSVLLTFTAMAMWTASQRRVCGNCVWLWLGIIVIGVAVVSALNVGDVSYQVYRRSAHLLACMNMLVATGFIAVHDLLRSLDHGSGERWHKSAFRTPSSSDSRGGWGSIIVAVLGVLALLVQLQVVRAWGNLYVNDVRSINQADVAAGRWLASNTPPDAYVAVNDVGAIAYFGQRAIFDMVGLVSPEATDVLHRAHYVRQERDRQMRDLLLARGVDYVVIFPSWLPWLAEDPMLHEVQRFTVENPSALGGKEVIIYQLK